MAALPLGAKGEAEVVESGGRCPLRGRGLAGPGTVASSVQ